MTIAVVIATALVFWFAPSTRQIIVYAARFVRQFGDWGPAAFAAVYALCVVTLIPAAPMSLLAGILFGMKGFPLVMIAAILGASFAFLVARYLIRDFLLRYLSRDSKLRVIDKAIADDGWKIVVLFRLSPLVPFNLQNYILGATRLRFWPYVTSTFVGMIPGTLVFVYLGAAGKAAWTGKNAGPLEWTLFAAGLVATVVVTWMISKRARDRLARVGVRSRKKQ